MKKLRPKISTAKSQRGIAVCRTLGRHTAIPLSNIRNYSLELKKSLCFIRFLPLFFGLSIFPLLAYPAAGPSVEELVFQIEERRGSWISFRADLEIHFLTADRQSASCKGKLAYQRLDEKILLQCFNERGELLFIFKTFDKNFELYLPSQAAVFQGDIFSLEDSPSIESHLRALDLYRALKPAAIPFEAQLEPHSEAGKWRLKIYGSRGENSLLAREVIVTAEGDVIEENYYQLGLSRPSVGVNRSGFEKINDSVSNEEFFFPRKIRIESVKEISGVESVIQTVLLFQTLEFLSQIPEDEFLLSLPHGTKTIALRESFG